VFGSQHVSLVQSQRVRLLARVAPARLQILHPDRLSAAPGDRAAIAHAVAGHIRQLPPGRHVSDAAIANYEAAVRTVKVVGQRLHDGETFVQQHARDGRPRRRRK
jgi:hypothetical protein